MNARSSSMPKIACTAPSPLPPSTCAVMLELASTSSWLIATSPLTDVVPRYANSSAAPSSSADSSDVTVNSTERPYVTEETYSGGSSSNSATMSSNATSGANHAADEPGGST